MSNEMKEVLNELHKIRAGIEYIKKHIVDDAILTPEEDVELDDSLKELDDGETYSLDEIKFL